MDKFIKDRDEANVQFGDEYKRTRRDCIEFNRGADWAREWFEKNVELSHPNNFKNYVESRAKIRELQAKADKLAEAIEEADKYLSVSSREMIGSNSILHKKMKDALKEFRGEE